MDGEHPIADIDKPRTDAPQIQIQRTPLSEYALQRVYVLGQQMCPTPLPYHQLKGWVEQCPDFCIYFQAVLEGAAPTSMGVIILLPLLKKFWIKFIVGGIRESSIDPTTMFARDPGEEVGLHIFYIERFETGSRQRNFGILALNATRVIAEKKGWKVAGFSALTATPAGRAACSQVGFTPTGYEEIALTRHSNSGDTKVDIIYIYPDGKVLGEDGHGQFHSKSEMVVRYDRPFPDMTRSRL